MFLGDSFHFFDFRQVPPLRQKSEIGFVLKSLKETIKQKLGPNSTRKEVLEKCQQIIRTVYEGLHQICRNRCKELWKRKREQGIAEFRTESITQ
jgi:hypothetical protein